MPRDGAPWEPKEGTVKTRSQHHFITALSPRRFSEILLLPIIERRKLSLEVVTKAQNQGHWSWSLESAQGTMSCNRHQPPATSSTLPKQPELFLPEASVGHPLQVCLTVRDTVNPARLPCHLRHLRSVFRTHKRHLCSCVPSSRAAILFGSAVPDNKRPWRLSLLTDNSIMEGGVRRVTLPSPEVSATPPNCLWRILP